MSLLQGDCRDTGLFYLGAPPSTRILSCAHGYSWPVTVTTSQVAMEVRMPEAYRDVQERTQSGNNDGVLVYAQERIQEQMDQQSTGIYFTPKYPLEKYKLNQRGIALSKS